MLKNKNKLTFSKREYNRLLKENPSVREDTSVNRYPDTPSETPDLKKLLELEAKTADGLLFDSILECTRYKVLRLWESAKIITNLSTQHEDIGKGESEPRKHWWLLSQKYRKNGKAVRSQYYVDDFQYYIDGVLIVEDVKGHPTRVFLNKWKLVETSYPDVNFFLNYSKDGWYPNDYREQWKLITSR